MNCTKRCKDCTRPYLKKKKKLQTSASAWNHLRNPKTTCLKPAESCLSSLNVTCCFVNSPESVISEKKKRHGRTMQNIWPDVAVIRPRQSQASNTEKCRTWPPERFGPVPSQRSSKSSWAQLKRLFDARYEAPRACSCMFLWHGLWFSKLPKPRKMEIIGRMLGSDFDHHRCRLQNACCANGQPERKTGHNVKLPQKVRDLGGHCLSHDRCESRVGQKSCQGRIAKNLRWWRTETGLAVSVYIYIYICVYSI